MLFNLSSKGDWKHTRDFLEKMVKGNLFANLDMYGKAGVNALASATPQDSGKTAQAWNYRVINRPGHHGIEWYNTNVNNGKQIAILIQYGHGTGTGGYVLGRDYINPAIRPIFDQMISDIVKQVSA